MYKREYLPQKIHSFIENGNYREIAVYGIGMVGELFADYLASIKVYVSYGIDKHADRTLYDLEILYPDEVKSSTDLVIVVPFYEYEIIKMELENYTHADIVSIEDVIYLI